MTLVADDRVTRVGGVAVLAAVLLSLAMSPLDEATRTGVAGVVALVLIAAGSPHGALDHVVLVTTRHNDRARAGSRPRHLPMTLFVLGYVAVALVSLAGYLIAPRIGFALFLAISIAHFAAGEAAVAVERGYARSWGDPVAWLASLGGAVVVVLPLASREAGAAVAAVDPRLAAVLGPLPVLADLLLVVVVLGLIACVGAELAGRSRARTVALELAGLTALALLAHPLLAFGAFFACWHSVRHQARLADLQRPGGQAASRYTGRPLLEVAMSARAGLPATVGVLLAAAALTVTGASALGALLAVIWALTVPHVASVAVLEARQARARRARGTDEPAAASENHDSDASTAVGSGSA